MGLKERRTAPFRGWVWSGVDFRVQSKGEHVTVPDFSLLRPIIRQESLKKILLAIKRYPKC